MSQGGTAVGVLFCVFGLLAVGLGVGGSVLGVRRARLAARTLTEGLPAEARCLDAYVTHERVGSDAYGRRTRARRHVVLGFRTREGDEIRLTDTSGAPRVVGDRVAVRYLPDQPHRAVVADRGRAGAAAGAGAKVVVGLIAIACGAGLLIAGYGSLDGSRNDHRPPGFPASTPAPAREHPSSACTLDPSSGRFSCS
ncbi:DUF3592 domain-containing protein [Kitasatospora sp. NPDC018619]|uniref:DUF3592 domain-containing protein n=1 Tax=unclassified Kitasatospora TaxID=2633591 RepID=UPI003799A4C1